MSEFQCIKASLLIACATGALLADTLHVPADYPTIQAAINASVDGDVVLVADGTYTGDGNRDIDFAGRAITVEGAGLCIIDVEADMADPHRAFWFHSGEDDDSIVRGLTVRNGFMDRGGAVLCEDGSSPFFEACVFEDNTAWAISTDDGGGAVHVGALCSPAFLDCEFVGNHVEDLAGFEGGGAIRSTPGSSLTLTDCLFDSNTAAPTGPTWGGAIYDWGGILTLSGCTFTANSAPSAGAITTYFTTMTQTDCTYIGNSSEFAGAVWDDASVCEYVDCTFTDNFTIDTGGDNSGGAYIANDTASVMFSGCTFTNNSTPSSGGGIGTHTAFVELQGCEFVGNSAFRGGGVYGNVNSVFSVEDCHFEANSADLAGAGMQFILNTEATINRCTIVDNVAPGGGVGARIGFNATATIANTLFAGNQATGLAAGLWIGANNGQFADVTVVNSTFTGNQSVVGGAIVVESFGDLTLANSILWGDDAGNELAVAALGEANVSYSNVQGGWPGVGNVDVDPLFADVGGCPYTPTASAVIDAGDNCALPDGMTTDLCGDPRFVDYPGADNIGVPCEGDLAIVDMGAQERQCLADCNGDAALNILDFVCYQGLFQAADPGADCNADGALNILDFVCFQGLFQAGCP